MPKKQRKNKQPAKQASETPANQANSERTNQANPENLDQANPATPTDTETQTNAAAPSTTASPTETQPTAQPPRKVKHHRIYYAFFTLTLLLGVFLLLLPLLFNWRETLQRQPKMREYEEAYIPPTDKTLDLINRYNAMIDAKQHNKSHENIDITQIQPDLKSPIGYINIPSIHIKNMLIYFGDSDWVLNRALGTMPWTSLPTGGKNTLAAITGHSGLANKIFFDNIRYLKKGDVFYVNAFGRNRAYQVTGHKVVAPSGKAAVQSFYVQPDKDLVALMTCTPLFINSHRLIVYGKRIPIKSAKKVVTTTRDRWSLEHIWYLTLFILILLLLIWWLIRRYRKRGIEKQKKRIAEEQAKAEEAAKAEVDATADSPTGTPADSANSDDSAPHHTE